MTAQLAEILRRERASVFFHARWSGPSVVALRLLRERLAARSIAEDEICIIDVDTEEETIHRLRDKGFCFGGGGEAMVIHHGKVRYFVMLAAGAVLGRTLTEAFLDAHRA